METSIQDSALPRPDTTTSRSAATPAAAGTRPLQPSAEPPPRVVEIQHIQPPGRPLTSASDPGIELPAPPDATLFTLIRKGLTVLSITLIAMAIAVVFDESVRNEVFKLVVVLYFALLPALIYFQFVSIRGVTLWQEYTENLYRLQIDDPASLPQPSRRSRYYRIWLAAQPRALAAPDAKTLYQRKFESAFGPIAADHQVRVILSSERLTPVILATVLFSAGWILVVKPYSFGAFGALHDPMRGSAQLWTAMAGRGAGAFPIDPIRFGFLGSYFYSMQMLVRRYFQNDLKAGAFLHATMRMVVVTLLTWAVDVAVRDASLDFNSRASLAFAIGVFPDLGWKALAAAPKRFLRGLVPSLEQPYPLSDLDGLNAWYESRLLEVGVEDMQNLATCNLPAVMLATRIPVERLVDWIDQSILFLHVAKPAPTDADKNAVNPRAQLRRYGIRTATDLEDAFAICPGGGAGEPERIAQLERLLTTAPTEPSVLRSVLATFQREPNLRYVRAWRGAPQTRDEALAWQADAA